jgi:predicted DCC family thiol-disulfide oxidoreductase YuxK
MVVTNQPAVRGTQRVRDFLQARYFGADLRWLGVFRIGLGLLLTCDLLRRWVEAREYYTNDGFLPNHFSLFRPMGDDLFSLLHAFSTLGEVSVVFALMLVVFVSLTLGYRTGLMQVLAFISITSLDARNIFIENGGDVLVNLMAFLSMFLPLGKRFSVDAVLASLRARKESSPAELNDRSYQRTESNDFHSLIVLAMLLQLAVIYFFNAVHKSGRGWADGSAIYWFLEQDRIVTALGVFLREHTPYPLIRGVTYGALAIEFALPAILLFPFAKTWMHRIAFLLGIGLHGGIALTSRLGPFSYAMMLFYVQFLAARDAELVGRWFSRESRRRTVIFDSDCGICLFVCRVLARLDPQKRLTFIGNDDVASFPPGVDPKLVDSTVVVVDPSGRVHIEERAVFEVAQAIPFGVVFAFWLRVPGLNLLGRGLYRVVARNRMRISTFFGMGACGIPPKLTAAEPEKPRGKTYRETLTELGSFSREMAVAVVVVMLGVQVINDNGYVHRFFRVKRPEWVVSVVNTFRLLEGWGMFAPEPPYDDGRIVVDGRTKDGRKLDPFTLAEPDFDPYTATGWGHEQFWCDYNNRIRFPGHAGNRQHLKDYLLKWHEYKDRPQDQLVAFDVWWVSDKSPRPGGPRRGEPRPPEKLLSHGFVRDSGAKPWLKPSNRPSRASGGNHGGPHD